MRRWHFDSSALLAFWLGEPDSVRVSEILANSESEILICSLSFAEAGRKSIELGATDLETSKMLDLFKSIATEIVVVDEAIARLSLYLSQNSATRLPFADSLIAACAHAKNATLLHRDKHFLGISAAELQQEMLGTQ